MDFKFFIKYFIIYTILVLLQVSLLNNISISSLGVTPYLYLLLILLIPFETQRWILLIIAFILGISIDIFSNTIALHTTATLFVAFIRPAILNILSPRNGYETGTSPGIKDLGFAWFLKYAFILSFIHSFIFIFFEALSFYNFHLTILNIIFTTIFSTTIIMITQFIFIRRKNK